jgi:hypothetical protein
VLQFGQLNDFAFEMVHIVLRGIMWFYIWCSYCQYQVFYDSILNAIAKIIISSLVYMYETVFNVPRLGHFWM